MAEVITVPPSVVRRSHVICAALLILIFGMMAAAALTWPDAPGTTVSQSGGSVVDLSNASLGYICVKYAKSDQKIKLRIAHGDDTYTYDLNADGEYAVFPLQMGSGNYAVTIYRQVKGTQYAQDSSYAFDVSLADENAAFLCPNQYVWYTKDSPAALASAEICKDLSSDRERADAVYQYIVDHMVYNYMRALTVESGYLPDVDLVYRDAMGICFDFSALMTCMLRVESIPTRMVIGYADENYHAWNEVLLGGEWVRYDATSQITNTAVKQYTAQRYY